MGGGTLGGDNGRKVQYGERLAQHREKRATADRQPGKTQLEEWPVSK